MRWALVDSNNKVINVIEYNGNDPYQPDGGVRLRQVEDWVQTGNDADIVKPIEKPVDHVSLKKMRNDSYKDDLSIKAAYSNEKKVNPNLNFSDFLDSLEALVVQ